MTRTYNAGRRPNGEEVKVDNIDEFWETAPRESLNGVKFRVEAYDLMCFDDLPYKVRDALRNASRNYNTSKFWDMLKVWPEERVLEIIQEMEESDDDGWRK